MLKESKITNKQVQHNITISEISEYLNQKKIIIALVDYRSLYNIHGSYLGHYLIITGIDSQYIYYHETAV
jgi:hypothetical protein